MSTDGREPLLVVLSGPGGVGKGTLARRLVELDDQLDLSRSWTTRNRRPGEAEDAYVFVDRAAFIERRAAGGFLEWNEFLGNLYGTPVIDGATRDVLLEIDVNGARQVVTADPEALLLFVDTPDLATQQARLEERGDPPHQVRQRLEEGVLERRLAADLGATVIVNDDFDTAIDELRAAIDAQRARRSALR